MNRGVVPRQHIRVAPVKRITGNIRAAQAGAEQALHRTLPRISSCSCVVKVPLGVGSACTSRVGQLLGALRPQQARFTCKVALAVQGRPAEIPVEVCVCVFDQFKLGYMHFSLCTVHYCS